MVDGAISADNAKGTAGSGCGGGIGKGSLGGAGGGGGGPDLGSSLARSEVQRGAERGGGERIALGNEGIVDDIGVAMIRLEGAWPKLVLGCKAVVGGVGREEVEEDEACGCDCCCCCCFCILGEVGPGMVADDELTSVKLVRS